MKKRIVVILLAVLGIMTVMTFAVSADHDGRNTWCNIDNYGCWVTDEDGGMMYIMFWSEEGRAYIMGSHSKPGELVVQKPTEGGRLGLDNSSEDPILAKLRLLAHLMWQIPNADLYWKSEEELFNLMVSEYKAGKTDEDYIDKNIIHYKKELEKYK